MILYSTGCPNCRILKEKLKAKNIAFEECNDVDKMVELGFTRVPILEVDGKFLEFQDALLYLQNN